MLLRKGGWMNICFKCFFFFSLEHQFLKFSDFLCYLLEHGKQKFTEIRND